jgi:hypothetical protein
MLKFNEYTLLLEKKKRKRSKYLKMKDSIKRSRSFSPDMKEELKEYLTGGTKFANGKLYGLKKPKIKGKSFSGVSIGADKDGYFVYTHRARSKSYKTMRRIPNSAIKFIKSTG